MEKDTIKKIGEVLKVDTRPELFARKFHLHPSVDERTATRWLAQCFKNVVESRGRQVIWDVPTKKHVEEMGKWLVAAEGTEFGILLQGTCGNGKTTLMIALQMLMAKLGDYGGTFSHMGMWFKPGMEIIHAKEIVRACVDDKNEYKRIREKDVLGIDDLGTETAEVEQYRNIMAPMVDLLEYRYTKRKFTIATTNLPVRPMKRKDQSLQEGGAYSLASHYGERIADRMMEMFHRITYTNDSYRGS